jgi:CBS domain-containing protein
MLARKIGSVLVVDTSGSLVGIFSERDLLMKIVGLIEDYRKLPIGDFMTRRPETISEDASLAYALHKMDCGGYRHLPVLNAGKLVGMISVRDLLLHLTNKCREILPIRTDNHGGPDYTSPL